MTRRILLPLASARGFAPPSEVHSYKAHCRISIIGGSLETVPLHYYSSSQVSDRVIIAQSILFVNRDFLKSWFFCSKKGGHASLFRNMIT